MVTFLVTLGRDNDAGLPSALDIRHQFYIFSKVVVKMFTVCVEACLVGFPELIGRDESKKGQDSVQGLLQKLLEITQLQRYVLVFSTSISDSPCALQHLIRCATPLLPWAPLPFISGVVYLLLQRHFLLHRLVSTFLIFTSSGFLCSAETVPVFDWVETEADIGMFLAVPFIF